jgi:hypothetical protein
MKTVVPIWKIARMVLCLGIFSTAHPDSTGVTLPWR